MPSATGSLSDTHAPSHTDLTALLTADQVALLLGVTPRTVRTWARKGALERVLLGGRLVRYTRASVAALMTPNEHDPGVTRGREKEASRSGHRSG